MKTKLIIAAVMVIIFSIAATMFFSMTSRYTEAVGIAIVADGGLLIVVDDMPIAVSNQSLDDELFSEVKTGDKVEITHDGVAESYPAQTGVYRLEIIESDCFDEISQSTIDSLANMGWIAVLHS